MWARVGWGDAVAFRVCMGVPVEVGGGGQGVSNIHSSRGSQRMQLIMCSMLGRYYKRQSIWRAPRNTSFLRNQVCSRDFGAAQTMFRQNFIEHTPDIFNMFLEIKSHKSRRDPSVVISSVDKTVRSASTSGNRQRAVFNRYGCSDGFLCTTGAIEQLEQLKRERNPNHVRYHSGQKYKDRFVLLTLIVNPNVS